MGLWRFGLVERPQRHLLEVENSMEAAADDKDRRRERPDSRVCSRVPQTCWPEMAHRRWSSKVRLNMEKPVREEMSVSAVMPLVDSGADADPCCSGADRDSTVQRT